MHPKRESPLGSLGQHLLSPWQSLQQCWGWELPLAPWRALPECDNEQPFQLSPGLRDIAGGSSLGGGWGWKGGPMTLGEGEDGAKAPQSH